jgi:hypothetical protein
LRLTRAATLLLVGLVVLDLVAVSATFGVLQVDPLRAAAAELRHAKVAVIVGPVGSLTADYRGLADDAVAAARRLTADVVTVYSPNATWPAVRRAMQGASVVVYLGHGNGWPSPYGDSLNRASQDGLGLNPVAGVDDTAHQYFGEAAIGKSVRLAPGAIVLLHHLCYASGAGEPGMPNPPLDVARERVDNFGAGWLAAGASAVVAEGHLGPAYYVAALLKGKGTPEQIWRASPTFHGHVQASASVRTPGATVLLDPDTASSGYYRSLVELPGAAAPPDLAAASGPLDPGVPVDAGSLVAAGAGPATADLSGPTVAGSADLLAVTFDPLTVPFLPADLEIGTTWTRIGDDGAAPLGPGSGDAAQLPGGPPVADIAATQPPAVDLVVAEAPGSLVGTAPASGSGRRRVVKVPLPATPGVYRLVATLHDRDGVAYDSATQALVPALIVHVTGRLWVSYGAPDQLTVTAGESISVSIRVANTGSQDWGPRPLGDTVDPEPPQPEPLAHVVGHWLPLDSGSSDGPLFDALAGSTPVADITPGSSDVVDLGAWAPLVPGPYLLVVDVVTWDGHSLAAAGVPPALVRVVVTAPPDDVPIGRQP